MAGIACRYNMKIVWSSLRFLAASVLALGCFGAQAQAVITRLFSPDEMTTAFFNDFETAMDLGLVSFSGSGIAEASAYAAGVTPSGTQGLKDSPVTTIWASFSEGYTAIGMFFGNDCCSTAVDAVLTIRSDSTVLGSVSVPGNMNTQADQFIGLSSSVPFNNAQITYSPRSLVRLTYIDDFRLGSPVPEPQACALMLAGLGVLGLAARRRKG